MNYSVFTKSNNFAYLKSPPYIFTSSLLSPTLRPNGITFVTGYECCQVEVVSLIFVGDEHDVRCDCPMLTKVDFGVFFFGHLQNFIGSNKGVRVC